MFVFSLTVFVIFLDILSKYLTVQLLLPLEREIVVIPYLLNFAYVENRGAAFGMLQDKRWIFMTLSIVLLVFLVFFVKYSKIKHPLFLISCSMIMGGGIGNMIDRVFVGYVVDFIKVTFIDFPVFNVADSAVVVGTILLAVYFVIYDFYPSIKKTDGKKIDG
ncbi:MAG: signal peptidase II [Ruminococcaceae bacterium]|nr:signal peptidase II [Oscillospiraceae bacterium]